jgi:hypothetical protein
VFYLERIALPPTAELHVALFDVADPEQPEQIVAELTEFLGDRQAAIPVVVSFTVETDGRLPSGQSLGEAIEEVDAQTEGAAAYFMVNCAHPTHFADVLEDDGGRVERIRGCGRTPRRRATRSSTSRTSSTRGARPSSPSSTST